MGKIKFSDRMMSMQSVCRLHYKGTDENLATDIYDTIINSCGLRHPCDELIIQNSPEFTLEEMASDPIFLKFLQILILLKQPKSVLEIGTFIGISAMYMAASMQADAELITIEKYDHFAGIARENFIQNNLQDKIKLIEGDAFEEVKKLGKDHLFDMIFLDANKERYDEYFELVDPLLKPQGLMVVDNVFFNGDALKKEPSSDKGIGAQKLLYKAKDLKNYQRVILPIVDGVMLLIKL